MMLLMNGAELLHIFWFCVVHVIDIHLLSSLSNTAVVCYLGVDSCDLFSLCHAFIAYDG